MLKPAGSSQTDSDLSIHSNVDDADVILHGNLYFREKLLIDRMTVVTTLYLLYTSYVYCLSEFALWATYKVVVHASMCIHGWVS